MPEIKSLNESLFKKRYPEIMSHPLGHFGTLTLHRLQYLSEDGEGKEKIVSIKKSKISKQDISSHYLYKQAEFMEKIQCDNLLQYEELIVLNDENMTKITIITFPFYSQDLEKYLNDHTSIDEEKKIRICFEISEGIKKLHEYNTIHEDLKPENILVDENNSIKLTCFKYKEEEEKLTKIVEKVNSVYKFANKKQTKENNIFSVGLIFYRIFKGEPLYTQEEIDELKSEENQDEEKINEKIKELDCNDKIKDIIRNCLHINKSERFTIDRVNTKLWNLIPSDQRNMTKNDSLTVIEPPKDTRSFDHQIHSSGIEKNKQNYSEFLPSQNESIENSKILGKIEEENRTMIYSENETPKNPEETDEEETSLNLLHRLLAKRRILKENLVKNKNFKVIYEFYVNRHEKFRSVESLKSIKSFTESQRNIIMYVVLFGYMRFLTIHEKFLGGHQTDENISSTSNLKSIEGIEFEDISNTTKEKCLEFVTREKKIVLKELNEYSQTINGDLDMYRELLDTERDGTEKSINSMIKTYSQKSFLGIENFEMKNACEYLKKIVLDEGRGKIPKDIEKKEEFLKIKEIF